MPRSGRRGGRTNKGNRPPQETREDRINRFVAWMNALTNEEDKKFLQGLSGDEINALAHIADNNERKRMLEEMKKQKAAGAGVADPEFMSWYQALRPLKLKAFVDTLSAPDIESLKAIQDNTQRTEQVKWMLKREEEENKRVKEEQEERERKAQERRDAWKTKAKDSGAWVSGELKKGRDTFEVWVNRRHKELYPHGRPTYQGGENAIADSNRWAIKTALMVVGGFLMLYLLGEALSEIAYLFSKIDNFFRSLF